MPESKRRDILREVFWRPLVGIANAILLAYGACTAFRDAFPSDVQAKYQLNLWLPHWKWQTGLMLFALLNVLLVFEGAVIAIRKREREHARTHTEIARLTEKPDIRGDILAAFWAFGVDQQEERRHSVFVIKLRLVNHNDVPCTIRAYLLALDAGQRQLFGEGQPSRVGRLLHPISSYTDDRTDARSDITATYPMNITSEWPLERARDKIGWITFEIRNYVPECVGNDVRPELTITPWNEHILITITDSLGNLHRVEDFTTVGVAHFSWG